MAIRIDDTSSTRLISEAKPEGASVPTPPSSRVQLGGTDGATQYDGMSPEQARFRSQAEADRALMGTAGTIKLAETGILQVAGALSSMRLLAVKAADLNLPIDQRVQIREEFKGLVKEVERVSAVSPFHEEPGVDGSLARISSRVNGIGDAESRSGMPHDADKSADEEESSPTLKAELGIEGISISSPEEAASAVDTIDDAYDRLATLAGRALTTDTGGEVEHRKARAEDRVDFTKPDPRREPEKIPSRVNFVMSLISPRRAESAARAAHQLISARSDAAVRAQGNVSPRAAMHLLYDI